MIIQTKLSATDCPVTVAVVRQNAKSVYDDLVRFCEADDAPFWRFEKELLVRIAVLGCCLIRLFLTARYERLDLQPFLKDGKYRPGDNYAERTLKTFYGEVTLWPSLFDVARRRQRVLSTRRRVGTDTRSPVALGHAMGRTLVDTHEFQSRANGVQSSAPLGAGH
jgi:hypothetical protein